MYSFLISLLAFIVAVGFLVTFHEFGHYWVARRLGVKVLRFSVGFGNILYRRVSKSGVEFCVSAIPLGGYVKMLDEREGEVPPDELPYAFNRQSVSKRFLIVLAGPLFNFLLAIVLFATINLMGISGVAPMISTVQPDGIAYQAGLRAGDEIIAVNGHSTPTYKRFARQLMGHMGDESVLLQIKRGTQLREFTLTNANLQTVHKQSPFEQLGFDMGLPALVGKIAPDSPAQEAKLQSGDQIIAVNGQPIEDWMQLVVYVSERPGELIQLAIKRNDQTFTTPIVPARNEDGRGYMGVYLSEQLTREERLGVGPSLVEGVRQTWDYTILTFKMIGYMITGRASLEQISGPVTIAQIAGETAQVGLSYYIDFLAIISVSLGVLNLLPIPMLDGGHLFYYVIEMMRRKPLSEEIQMKGFRIGLVILVSLFLVAFYNDILRLV